LLALTSKERRALLIISGVLLASIVVQWLRPHQNNPAVYDYSLQDSLFKALSDDTTQAPPAKNAAQVIPGEKKKTSKQAKRNIAKKPALLQPHSIDINHASLKELQRLPGVGPATAKRIVKYREQNGSFKSLEELIKIKRIGPKTLEKMRPYLTIHKEKPLKN